VAKNHTVTCDRCEKEKSLDEDYLFGQRDSNNADHSLPEGWHEIAIHHGGVMGHLCSRCWTEYQEFEEEFYRSAPEASNIVDESTAEGDA
jgi:hypothetical protein